MYAVSENVIFSVISQSIADKNLQESYFSKQCKRYEKKKKKKKKIEFHDLCHRFSIFHIENIHETCLFFILTHLAIYGKQNRILFCNNSLGVNAWRCLAPFYEVILLIEHISLKLAGVTSFLRALWT